MDTLMSMEDTGEKTDQVSAPTDLLLYLLLHSIWKEGL